MKRICVFCGSNPGNHPEYAESARRLGRAMVQAGMELVYGGGNVGLMGVVADTVLAGGGAVTGVIPGFLKDLEVAHLGLTKLHVVETMHERKALMADLADAFICLPGGFGTFDEFCEILTWSQLRIQPKPCGILNVRGYYNNLIAQFDLAVEEGFLKAPHRALFVVGQEETQLLAKMGQFVHPYGDKWLNRELR